MPSAPPWPSRSARTAWRPSARPRRRPTSSPATRRSTRETAATTRVLPDDPLTGLPIPQPLRPQALRRVGGDHALQLPARPGRRPRGGGARHRQHASSSRARPTRPWAGRLLADCIRDAGFPPGVFNYVTGRGSVVGEALTGHPDLAGVTFTGSYDVGMRLYRKMAAGRHPRPCIAEMGGKNACVVTAHGDLERAATGIVRSAFGLTGQKCSALSRVYVEEAVAERAPREGDREDARHPRRRPLPPRELDGPGRQRDGGGRLRAVLRSAPAGRRAGSSSAAPA